jgi:nucleotide-binding universal stress UspA family protein
VTHIIVGYDGTSSGRLALQRAADVHRPGDVVDVISVTSSHDRGDVMRDVAVRRSLHEALTFLDASGISAAGAAVAGDPAVAICALAARDAADLIIVGRGDPGERDVWARASVSARIVDWASCDVLVAKRPGAPSRVVSPARADVYDGGARSAPASADGLRVVSPLRDVGAPA